MENNAQTQQQAQPPQQDAEKKGFFGSLSLLQKIILFLLILGFVFLVAVFALGGVNSIWELIFVLFAAIVLFIIAYIVIVAGQIIFRKEYYSPKEDWYTRCVNAAIDYKPDNLNDLYFRGSDWKKLCYAGKIIGCLGIPYFIGEPIRDEKGQQKWYYSKLLKKKVPQFDKILYGKDGDTLFVFEKGWFIFKKRHVLRCHHSLHTDLNGDVIVDDINPQPYGSFWEYPYKQIQKDISRIMLQAQLETIIATHEHQGDLISQSADSGIYYNPFFKLVRDNKAELAREN